jgi:hypothetical protein
MNSLKFLAFGKSWAAGRDVIGRFRMRENCLLPRFEEEPGGVGAAIEPVSWWRRLGSLFGFRRRSEAAVRPVVPTTEQPEAGVESPFQAVPPDDGGNMKPEGTPGAAIPANPFAAAPVAVAEAPAPAAVKGTAVQREFRFEHVTVVCNDLHDADVEIEVLPAPRRRRSQPAAMEQPVLLSA